MGTVVQSIVSLTTNSLTVVAKAFANTLMFCCKKISSFSNAKATFIFAARNINAFAIFQDINFNVTLATKLSFEQLGPD